jgi:hypothetical protein
MTTKIGKSNFVGTSQSTDSKPAFGNPLNHPPAEGGMRNTTIPEASPEQDIIDIVNNSIASGDILVGGNGLFGAVNEGGTLAVNNIDIDSLGLTIDTSPDAAFTSTIDLRPWPGQSTINSLLPTGSGSKLAIAPATGTIELRTVDTDDSTLTRFTASGFFTDSRSSTVGIQYGGDYSADFTDRSLVDKAYVDGLAGGPVVETYTQSVDGNAPSITNKVDVLILDGDLNDGNFTPSLVSTNYSQGDRLTLVVDNQANAGGSALFASIVVNGSTTSVIFFPAGEYRAYDIVFDGSIWVVIE